VGDGETFFRAEIVAALNAAGLDDPERPGGTAQRLFTALLERGLIEEIDGGYGANVARPLVLTDAPASPSPTATLNAIEAIVAATATPNTSSLPAAIGNSDPPASTTDPTLPIITQTITIGGLILSLIILGPVIWFGLSRLGRAITHEIHTASLANLRLQHEAERIDRREKVVSCARSVSRPPKI
jgi:hypothetical protein